MKSFIITTDVSAQMRDGVGLLADVYRPATSQRAPNGALGELDEFFPNNAGIPCTTWTAFHLRR